MAVAVHKIELQQYRTATIGGTHHFVVHTPRAYALIQVVDEEPTEIEFTLTKQEAEEFQRLSNKILNRAITGLAGEVWEQSGYPQDEDDLPDVGKEVDISNNEDPQHATLPHQVTINLSSSASQPPTNGWDQYIEAIKALKLLKL